MQKKLKFYDMDPSEQWDEINGVGLRNHFLCTVFASRIMVDRRDGLIVNVSSSGGIKYLFNVAYGVGKAACDRMAADCAVELKDNFVTMVSLWPGPVKTEYIQENVITSGKVHGPFYYHYPILPAAALSDWLSWQRHKSCGNSRTFVWVRVQLQTGVLSLLFSDSTQTPHLNLRNQTLSICIWVNELQA